MASQQAHNRQWVGVQFKGGFQVVTPDLNAHQCQQYNKQIKPAKMKSKQEERGQGQNKPMRHDSFGLPQTTSTLKGATLPSFYPARRDYNYQTDAPHQPEISVQAVGRFQKANSFTTDTSMKTASYAAAMPAPSESELTQQNQLFVAPKRAKLSADVVSKMSASVPLSDHEEITRERGLLGEKQIGQDRSAPVPQSAFMRQQTMQPDLSRRKGPAFRGSKQSNMTIGSSQVQAWGLSAAALADRSQDPEARSSGKIPYCNNGSERKQKLLHRSSTLRWDGRSQASQGPESSTMDHIRVLESLKMARQESTKTPSQSPPQPPRPKKFLRRSNSDHDTTIQRRVFGSGSGSSNTLSSSPMYARKVHLHASHKNIHQLDVVHSQMSESSDQSRSVKSRRSSGSHVIASPLLRSSQRIGDNPTNGSQRAPYQAEERRQGIPYVEGIGSVGPESRATMRVSDSQQAGAGVIVTTSSIDFNEQNLREGSSDEEAPSSTRRRQPEYAAADESATMGLLPAVPFDFAGPDKSALNKPSQLKLETESIQSQEPDESINIDLVKRRRSSVLSSSTVRSVRSCTSRKQDDQEEKAANQRSCCCTIDPNSKWKMRWDLFVMFNMIAAAILTPWQLAFVQEDSLGWTVFNLLIDATFFLDIIVTFCTAYFDEVKLLMVTDKRVIATKYLRFWFWLDLLSIIPFDLILKQITQDFGNLAKFTRIGKLYKLVRMLRMVKMVRLFKDRQRIISNLDNMLHIQSGYERLVFFSMGFVLFNHTLACIWIMLASFDKQNWRHTFQENYADSADYSDGDWYLVGLYFIATTVTTVGYGDITPRNNVERFFCNLLMFTGVCAFSFATGALGSIIASQDSAQARLNEKLLLLSKIKKQFKLSDKLFSELSVAIKYECSKNIDGLGSFMEQLPHKLKLAMSTEIHKDLAIQFSFFNRQPESQFLSFIGHRLTPRIIQEEQYLYQETEAIQEIFFNVQGKMAYVLPRYFNARYFHVYKGEIFGLEDVIYNVQLSKGSLDLKTMAKRKAYGERRFTVMSASMCEALTLNMNDLYKTMSEFPRTIELFYEEQQALLESVVIARLECTDQMQEKVQPVKPDQANLAIVSERAEEESDQQAALQEKEEDSQCQDLDDYPQWPLPNIEVQGEGRQQDLKGQFESSFEPVQADQQKRLRWDLHQDQALLKPSFEQRSSPQQEHQVKFDEAQQQDSSLSKPRPKPLLKVNSSFASYKFPKSIDESSGKNGSDEYNDDSSIMTPSLNNLQSDDSKSCLSSVRKPSGSKRKKKRSKSKLARTMSAFDESPIRNMDASQPMRNDPPQRDQQLAHLKTLERREALEPINSIQHQFQRRRTLPLIQTPLAGIAEMPGSEAGSSVINGSRSSSESVTDSQGSRKDQQSLVSSRQNHTNAYMPQQPDKSAAGASVTEKESSVEESQELDLSPTSNNPAPIRSSLLEASMDSLKPQWREEPPEGVEPPGQVHDRRRRGSQSNQLRGQAKNGVALQQSATLPIEETKTVPQRPRRMTLAAARSFPTRPLLGAPLVQQLIGQSPPSLDNSLSRSQQQTPKQNSICSVQDQNQIERNQDMALIRSFTNAIGAAKSPLNSSLSSVKFVQPSNAFSWHHQYERKKSVTGNLVADLAHGERPQNELISDLHVLQSLKKRRSSEGSEEKQPQFSNLSDGEDSHGSSHDQSDQSYRLPENEQDRNFSQSAANHKRSMTQKETMMIRRMDQGFKRFEDMIAKMASTVIELKSEVGSLGKQPPDKRT